MDSLPLPATLRPHLRCLIDRIVPSDGDPAVTDAIETFLLRQLAPDGALAKDRTLYERFLTALGAEFCDESEEAKDSRLRAAEASDEWRGFFRRMVEQVQEGFYTSPVGLQWIGWTVTDTAEAARAAQEQRGKLALPVADSLSLADRFDAIVVGAGAGGGVIAALLSEAGKTVLLLERGGNHGFGEIGRDPLRNQRLSQYGTNAGPDAGHPRVYVDSRGTEHTVLPHEGGYHNNAAIVGGGTRVYGAQAWRFHPLDFRMATTYGVPDGSSLADWPISYDDLTPFYERAERELGVAGDADSFRHLPGRSAYPMPPMRLNTQGRTMREAAAKLGWHTVTVPLAINTVPYLGRPACIHCQHCVGFPCPTEAKNGTHNTVIPRALATGRCHAETGAMVERIETIDGKAVGVTFFDASGQRRTVHAEVIVVAAGAIETARLLLNSGLGNDHVGRHLQGHYYPGAFGLLPEDIWDGIGPGPTTATCEFSHGNADESGRIVGGGMLADDFIPLAPTFMKGYTPPDLPRWGAVPKQWMRTNHHRTLKIMGPVQDIPSPDARVSVAHDVRDRFGIPVARLSGTTHPETVRTARFMVERAAEWVRAAGATETWAWPPGLGLSGGQHQSGTVRMSEDPAQGAADRFCRLHGHENLYIGDGSVHVTNGGFNPFLTIMAIAYRTGDHILRQW
ncbi:MAG: GMC family oxidoreductase N-terminal domain-containing protein [Capsulimonadales bacterium]|nr:GMC family oxidoreductase N-terminal domain-containing protein [Capsulimonadales bacterium]